jgi:pSer/pThr/pTyr-binding forkhead associated (FHA) protein
MWKLVIEDDENKRTSVPLLRDSYVVGRREGSTVRLTERNISREHCRITRRNDGTGYTLQDASSYNGVYVNGIRIDGVQELVHGDLVQIGDYRIILQDDSVGDAMAPLEPSSNANASAKTTQPLSNTARAASLLERPHRLVVLVGPTPGAEFSLEQPRLTVGRAEDCTLSINHNSVSRLHCEIHDLGEGRFEIVDKGSANGVRVNGADLRRGIIEAGDLIELGDVRFKFIGRGQVFVPGAGDSQQLTAIADRQMSSPPEGRRAPLLVLLIFCVVLMGAVVIGLLLRARAARLAALPEAEGPELRMLTDAKHACEVGDCDAARARLKLPESSPLRGSKLHRDIENRWAELQFKRVEQEPNVSKARELVEQVERNTLVSEALRRRANEWVAALDTPPTTAVDQPPPADPGNQLEAPPDH